METLQVLWPTRKTIEKTEILNVFFSRQIAFDAPALPTHLRDAFACDGAGKRQHLFGDAVGVKDVLARKEIELARHDRKVTNVARLFAVNDAVSERKQEKKTISNEKKEENQFCLPRCTHLLRSSLMSLRIKSALSVASVVRFDS